MKLPVSSLRLLLLTCAPLLACSSASPAASTGAREGEAAPPCAPPSPPWSLMVAASDEQSVSELGFLALGGASQFFVPLAGDDDPVIASSNGRLFWIARGLGEVLELDPACGGVLHGPWTTSDAAAGSTDPQDLAVDPATGNLWIARFLVPTILVKSPDGATPLGTIDLSSVAGVNKNPYMSSIRILGKKAYVTLEMLDENEDPTNPAYLVRLDVATALTTGKIEATLELKGRNPFGLMVEDDASNALYLAEPGSFFDATETDAGIERVDVATFTSELVVRESDLGASVDELAISGGCGVAIVAGPTALNVTSVITWNAETGALVTPLSSNLLTTPLGFKLGGLAFLPGSSGNLVAIGDGDAVAGKGYPIHTLSASSTCSLTATASALFAPEPPIELLPVAAE